MTEDKIQQDLETMTIIDPDTKEWKKKVKEEYGRDLMFDMKKDIEKIQHIVTLSDSIGKDSRTKEVNKIKYSYKIEPVIDIRMWVRKNHNFFDPETDKPQVEGQQISKKDLIKIIEAYFNPMEMKEIITDLKSDELEEETEKKEKIKKETNKHKNNKKEVKVNNNSDLREWNEIEGKEIMIPYAINLYMKFNDKKNWEANIKEIEPSIIDNITDLYGKSKEEIRSYSKWFDDTRWLGRKLKENKNMIEEEFNIKSSKIDDKNKIYKFELK